MGFSNEPPRGVKPFRPRRNRRVIALASTIVVAACVTGGVIALTRSAVHAAGPTITAAAMATPTPTPTPTTTPLTPSETLLATTADPHACAVSFAGDDVTDSPTLQTQGALYTGLPIPHRDGFVFGGWYATPADAASFVVASRVNGSKLVACANRQLILYGAWKTPADNAAENARIPIMMYHQFTSDPAGNHGPAAGQLRVCR